MKLTLIDNHLRVFPIFLHLSSDFFSHLLCVGWMKSTIFTCDLITLTCHLKFTLFRRVFLLVAQKSFCERFSCSAEINIFPLSRREYCFPIFHSLRRLLLQFILIFSHLVLSNVNSTRLFEINICLRLSFFAFFNTFFRDGIIYSC